MTHDTERLRMSLTRLNEKAIRNVVRPQLDAAFPTKSDKVIASDIAEYIARTDPRRIATAVPGLTQQLGYHFGNSEQNRVLAVRMLTAVFHDEDY